MEKIYLHLFIAVSFLFLATPYIYTQSSVQPNIVFVLTDDQRSDALGFAGNKIISTPHIDQKAGAIMFT